MISNQRVFSHPQVFESSQIINNKKYSYNTNYKRIDLVCENILNILNFQTDFQVSMIFILLDISQGNLKHYVFEVFKSNLYMCLRSSKAIWKHNTQINNNTTIKVQNLPSIQT